MKLKLIIGLVFLQTFFLVFPAQADKSFLNEPPFDSPVNITNNSPIASTLSIIDIIQNSVTISWTKNNDPDFAFYDLFRIVSFEPLKVSRIAHITDQNQTSFIDALPQGVTSYYHLRTYNQAGEFSRSNTLGALYVPWATITIDGSISDWSALTPSLNDYINDKTSTTSGTDISNVYLAHDSQYFYVRMDLADGSPNTQEPVYYSFNFDSQPSGSIIGDKYLRSQFFSSPEQNQSVFRQIISLSPYQAATLATDIAAVGQNTLEMRTPLNKLGTSLFYFYSRANTSAGPGISYDSTVQIAMKVEILPAPSTLSAEVLSSDEIRLSWTICPDPDFNRYELYKAVASGPFIKIATITNKNQTTFTDTDIQSETSYSYYLKTYNIAGLFSQSNPVGLSTLKSALVPFKTISIDGDFSDWQGIQPVFIDSAGDSTGILAGTDFTNFYLVQDGRYLYIRFDLANGLPQEGDPIYYQINFDVPPRGPAGQPDYVLFFWNFLTPRWVALFNPAENSCPSGPGCSLPEWSLGNSSMEIKVDLNFLGNPNYFFTTALNIYQGLPWEQNHWVDWSDIPEWEARLRPKTKDINIAVILAEPSDTSFDPVHDKQYFKTQIIPQIKDYWCEVSFGKRNPDGSCSGGKVNLNFEVFDDNGKPFKLEKTQEWYGKNQPEKIVFDCISDSPFVPFDDDDRTPEFGWDAIKKTNEVRPEVDFNNYDGVIVIYSSFSEQISNLPNLLSTQVHPASCQLNEQGETAQNWITVSEMELTRSWVHELGHALGQILTGNVLCDLYKKPVPFFGCYQGYVGNWDVMGGFPLQIRNDSPPPHLSSFSKIKLNWLGEDIIDIGFNDFIESLATMEFRDRVKRYNIPSSNSYYLLENRTNSPQYSNWDVNVPGTALVVYKVSPEEFTVDDRTYTAEVVNTFAEITSPYFPARDPASNLMISVSDFVSQPSSFKIKTQLSSFPAAYLTGLIIQPRISLLERIWHFLPLESPSYRFSQSDYPTERLLARLYVLPMLTERTAINFIEFNLFVWLVLIVSLFVSIIRKRYFKIIAVFVVGYSILHIAYFLLLWPRLFSSFDYKEFSIRQTIRAAIHHTKFALEVVILDLKVKTGLEPRPIDYPSPLDKMGQEFSLDLDLHAITPDGKHVGMNYQTGEYENQIPNAIASGDLVYDDEWIFVPEGTEVKYYASAYDIQQYLQANPDIAQQLPSTQETYNLSAIYYDSQSQRYESQPLTNLSINPGQNIVHKTTGTTDISVSPGIVDNEGPIITHAQLEPQYILNNHSILFHFSAIDEGIGLKEITATLDNQPITSGDHISFTQIGTRTIQITATDFLGNTSVKEIQFNVQYDFSGFLPPIKIDNTGIYKKGRTLPVKFQLKDANNEYVSTAAAYLYLSKIQGGITGTEEIPLSTSAADTGNQFRYDQESNQYIFNLSTGTMTPGTWQLRADLGDNAQRTVIVSMRE